MCYVYNLTSIDYHQGFINLVHSGEALGLHRFDYFSHIGPPLTCRGQSAISIDSYLAQSTNERIVHVTKRISTLHLAESISVELALSILPI